jgi:hypothetical protein
MSTQFDRLEKSLQGIIESSLSRLPGRGPQPRLAASLASTLSSQLELDGDSNDPLPDCFNLFMHPDNCKAWESHPEWTTWLNKVLLDMAAESGRSFTRDPEIRTIPDPGMDTKNVRAVLTYQEVMVSSTAVIPPEPEITAVPLENTWSSPYLMGDHQKTYPIEKSVFNIGRRENNDLVIPDPRVSREHAQIRVVHGECILFDLNSTGGTSVNGQRISTRTLRPGDVITFAGISFIFGEDSPSRPSSTGTSPTHFPV